MGLNPSSAINLKRDDPATPPPAMIAGTFSIHLSGRGSTISSLLPFVFISPRVTRLDIGPLGVGSPATSIPYGLKRSLALGMHLLPRHAPIPIREMCLSSSEEITFLSPRTASSLSTVISSQWHTYVLDSGRFSRGIRLTLDGYLSFTINPLASRSCSPSIVVAFTLATFVLLLFLVIFSIIPSPTFSPLLFTRNTWLPSSALYSIGRKSQFLLS